MEKNINTMPARKNSNTKFVRVSVEDGYYNFGSGGIILHTLNDFDFAIIKKEIEFIKSNFKDANDARQYLIGHLEKTFDVEKCKPVIERLVLSIVNEHNSYINLYEKSLAVLSDQDIENKELKLENCWVNFQQKHEFQPIHDHTGVFSFIIFYQIPFYFGEELKKSPGKEAREKLSGMLNFHYVDYTGDISSMAIPADKNWEKRIIVFPAKLKHSVYPFFSSDDYRITISGSLNLRDKGEKNGS